MLLPQTPGFDHKDVPKLIDSRPTKNLTSTDLDLEPSVPLHPLGIKPLGNQYLSSAPNARTSAGTFQILPDEVLAILLEYLAPEGVRRLGNTCKFLFAFCNFDDLWKTLFLSLNDSTTSSFKWRGSWRASVLNIPKDKLAKVDCSSVFSDVLHRPFVCSHIALGRYAKGIPAANKISRFEDISYDEFAATWSDRPFILTRPIRDWPVFESWYLNSLEAQYSDVKFRAESVDWPFSTYYQYLLENHDESPLYLFDRRFAEKMRISIGPEAGNAYCKPSCFGTDLFELLGDERPAHRWLIVGPERSGSTFHKDPNATSAWNAVVQGSKYWIMFPPSASVPGVYVSKDGGEVTSPLSIAEWLLEFHAEARRVPGCVEGVCEAGEILHVPSGWWHLVVNLEGGIALTQNFVPASHLPDVLAFLRDKPEQVTGFGDHVKDPYGLFVQRLEERHPDLLATAVEKLNYQRDRKKRRWDAAVGACSDEEQGQKKAATGFSFGFGDDGEIP